MLVRCKDHLNRDLVSKERRKDTCFEFASSDSTSQYNAEKKTKYM